MVDDLLVFPKMLDFFVQLVYTKNFVAWMLKLSSWKLSSTQRLLGAHCLTACCGSVVFLERTSRCISMLPHSRTEAAQMESSLNF